jgi:hypothetical protein
MSDPRETASRVIAREGDTVSADDHPTSNGVVTRLLAPTLAAVRWHDGSESEEHIADLAVVRRA